MGQMPSSSAACVSVVMILESQENGSNPIPVGYSLPGKPNPESSECPWTRLPESPTPNSTLSEGRTHRKQKLLWNRNPGSVLRSWYLFPSTAVLMEVKQLCKQSLGNKVAISDQESPSQPPKSPKWRHRLLVQGAGGPSPVTGLRAWY